MELRAASLTGRCVLHAPGAEFEECLAYHARWALKACFPAQDANVVLNRNWDRCYTQAIDTDLDRDGGRMDGDESAGAAKGAKGGASKKHGVV